MLTKEAFNALLKTIEDPPPNVVFILATTEEHKVLPTIVSRCQRLMFRLVTQEDLLQHLKNVAQKEDIEITDEAIEFVARRSGGGLRDALGLLDQASLLSAPGKPVDVKDLLNLLGALQEDVLLEMSEHIMERRGHALLQSAAKLLQDGREPAIVVQELARHFLNLAKASYLAGLPNPAEAAAALIVGSPSYLEALQEQAPKFERSELSQMVEMLDRLEQTCRRTTQPAMHLEVGLLALCHRQDMILIRELADRVAKLEQGGVQVQAAAAAPRAVASHAPAAPRQTAPTPAPAAAPAPAPAPMAAAPAPMSAPAPMPNPIPTPNPVPAPNPIPIPQPAAAAPAPTPRPSAPAAVAPSGDDILDGAYSADEVDRVWSIAIDELQRRNLPAHAVVTQHAFPLALNDKEFVIGVKEAMLKAIEGKAEHIKNACSTAVGKPINVRIKPAANVAPPPAPTPAARPAPAMREERPPAPVPAGAPGPDADDDYDDPDPAPRVKLDDLSGSAPAAAAAPAAQQAAAPAPAPAEGELNNAAPTRGGGDPIIKEAYRLFEGPGSRQIG
jgi:DNA polymerase-3 subunit gamma/tau